jgi:hypothetical protein
MKSKKYEKMSIKELKLEMKQCGNPIKKKLLKKLIEFKESEKPINNKQEELEPEEDIFEELIKHQVKINNKENSENLENLENLEYQNQVYDEKRTKDIKTMMTKDMANNKMMERLNGELTFRINGFDKKYIDKPYVDYDDIKKDKRVVQTFNTDDQVSYISKSNTHDIPITDFSSKRWI